MTKEDWGRLQPIEEQARLSIHPHILLWFVSALSEQWLRRVLRKETEEAKALLRGWQERVLATVQAIFHVEDDEQGGRRESYCQERRLEPNAWATWVHKRRPERSDPIVNAPAPRGR